MFNPFNLRSPRLLSYAFDFFRLNRRMHNKSFTVDGAATIIGGRNIGDIYFARDIQTIDLRMADRMTVRLAPDVLEDVDDAVARALTSYRTVPTFSAASMSR